MQSAWTNRDADAAVARYENLGRDVALRVYTTRLLGQDPRLVTGLITERGILTPDRAALSAAFPERSAAAAE